MPHNNNHHKNLQFVEEDEKVENKLNNNKNSHCRRNRNPNSKNNNNPKVCIKKRSKNNKTISNWNNLCC